MFDESPVVTANDIAAYITQTLADGPRRFALFGLAADRGDAGLIGWGLDFEDEAIFVTGGAALIRASSAAAVRTMLAGRGEVHLAWLDPVPSGQPQPRRHEPR